MRIAKSARRLDRVGAGITLSLLLAFTGAGRAVADTPPDTGPRWVDDPYAPHDTTGSLHDKLAALGASAIVELLPRLARGEVSRVAQDAALVTYAAKIGKDEARLDWNLPAETLDRRIRAFNPFPGAYAMLRGEAMKIWHAHLCPGQGTPGEILEASASGLRIACGQGALCLTALQRPGGKRLAVDAFLAGHAMTAGDHFA